MWVYNMGIKVEFFCCKMLKIIENNYKMFICVEKFYCKEFC